MPIDYAQISSTEDQRPTTTTPTQITLNQNDSISGIEHSAENPGTIRIQDSGIYVIIAAPQVGRTSGTQDRFVDFWIRKNGTDLANSNVRVVISGKGSKDVFVNHTMMPFDAGDLVIIMLSLFFHDVCLGIEAIHPTGEPLIPSIIFSMHKIKDVTSGHYVSAGRGTGRVWVE